jgi:hypothetical protein
VVLSLPPFVFLAVFFLPFVFSTRRSSGLLGLILAADCLLTLAILMPDVIR